MKNLVLASLFGSAAPLRAEAPVAGLGLGIVGHAERDRAAAELRVALHPTARQPPAAELGNPDLLLFPDHRAPPGCTCTRCLRSAAPRHGARVPGNLRISWS